MPSILKTEDGGHHYYKDGYVHPGTAECLLGCGCEMAASASSGPEGVDPFGLCPNNFLNKPVLPVEA